MKEWKPQTLADRIAEAILAILALAGVLIPCGLGLAAIIYIIRLLTN